MSSVSKEDVDIEFGKILKHFREKSYLTQDKLSEKLGISPKYISRIENGNGGIKKQTLIKYMNALGISPNTMYKEFITNEKVIKQIELSEKINDLSQEKLIFLDSIIDLLKNLK